MTLDEFLSSKDASQSLLRSFCSREVETTEADVEFLQNSAFQLQTTTDFARVGHVKETYTDVRKVRDVTFTERWRVLGCKKKEAVGWLVGLLID